jgi:hypothetical protein
VELCKERITLLVFFAPYATKTHAVPRIAAKRMDIFVEKWMIKG